MPIKIPNNLPATNVLESENVFVMNAARAYGQDIRPLRILILNLMPIKDVTETQLLRLLGNTPLQVEADFIYTESYIPSHTSRDYLTEFYGTFAEVRHKKYDGFIITGAPIEQLPFERVAYWDEVSEIMQWSRKHAYSTFHICWGAQAGLYYHYGIPKHWTEKKIFGVYEHRTCVQHEPLLRGFDGDAACRYCARARADRPCRGGCGRLHHCEPASPPVLHHGARRVRSDDAQVGVRPRPCGGTRSRHSVQLLPRG